MPHHRGTGSGSARVVHNVHNPILTKNESLGGARAGPGHTGKYLRKWVQISDKGQISEMASGRI